MNDSSAIPSTLNFMFALAVFSRKRHRFTTFEMFFVG